MKELWLEFGYIQKNNYHDTLWYNEGRWQEIPYFFNKLWKYRKETNMYFLIRFNRKKYLIKGK